MEKSSAWEQKTLIGELTLGRELAEQLKNQLDPMASHELCEPLIQKILSSYDKALSMLNLGALLSELSPAAAGMPDLWQSAGGNCPRSEASDPDFKDPCCETNVYKKRKTMQSQQVRVMGGALDDGYSWRKYGQKDILGANFPRAYYRCTHRHVQGCLATKQVQRSDEDPSMFDITYKGRHTCIPSSQLVQRRVSREEEEGEEEEGETQEQSKQTLVFGTLKTGIDLRSGDLGFNLEEKFPSFAFLSSSFKPETLDNQIWADSANEEPFLGNRSSPFLSPEKSESDRFKLSSFASFEMDRCFQALESSDLAEMLSTPAWASASNSLGEIDDFLLDQVDLDPNLPLDIFKFS